MLRCLIFSTSCQTASPQLPHGMLFGLLRIKWCYMILSSWCYGLTFSTSCYAASLFLNLSSRCYAAWCYVLHATLLHFPYVIPSCFVSFVSFFLPVYNCLHNATLLDLLYFMPQCLTFPTSCYFALSSPNYVFQLILSSWRYTAWFYLLHATVLHPLYLMSNCFTSSASGHTIWSCLYDATLLDLLYLMLPGPTHVMFFCILTKSCYAAWSGLHDASLLGLHCLILSCLIFPASCRTVLMSTLSSYASWPCLYDATLLDLLCLMLCCWTSLTRMQCCLMSSTSGHAISSSLHNARLLDLLHLLSGCWAFLTSCQGACRPPKHVVLFVLAFKMLHCLISIASCYAASPLSIPPVACCFQNQNFCSPHWRGGVFVFSAAPLLPPARPTSRPHTLTLTHSLSPTLSHTLTLTHSLTPPAHTHSL